MNRKTMLSLALEPLHAETGDEFVTQDLWWSDIFYSYCHTAGNEALSNAYVSKYRTGKRIITAKYLRHYSSSASLRLPPRLKTDLEKHLTRYATPVQLQRIYTAMIGYCQRQDPYDRVKLLPDVLLDQPDVDTTATLCAAVIWHAMCYDVAHTA